MKRYIIFVLFAASLHLALAQAGSDRGKTDAGVEIDILPYLTGGYYASAWVSRNHFRYRAVLTQVTTPEFMLEDGFTNNEIQVYALIVDYFFEQEVSKFWIGAGFEYWDAGIQTDLKLEEASYENTMFTLGGGYVWNVGRHLYLNPWAALHFRIAGDSEVPVDGLAFSPSAVTPEASLKLGWKLRSSR